VPRSVNKAEHRAASDSDRVAALSRCRSFNALPELRRQQVHATTATPKHRYRFMGELLKAVLEIEETKPA
jgi:hypothetical protein